MTGFGAAEGVLRGRSGDELVRVEIRSVNHRFFNPSLRLPASLSHWERETREVLRQRVARGHVTLGASLGRDAAASRRIDPAQFQAYLEQLRDLAARNDIAAPIDAATVLALPGVVTDREEGEAPDDPAPFLAVVRKAVDALDATRREEGGQLARGILARVAMMEQAMTAISQRAPRRLIEQRDRLRAAVRELLDGGSVDEARVSQEIALLADRLDIAEEIARFGAHVSAFRAAIEDGADGGVGKRLGFLLQELLREANTAGSKANDADIARHVLIIKEELERVREQVENLE